MKHYSIKITVNPIIIPTLILLTHLNIFHAIILQSSVQQLEFLVGGINAMHGTYNLQNFPVYPKDTCLFHVCCTRDQMSRHGSTAPPDTRGGDEKCH